jgi:hypothetical protein
MRLWTVCIECYTELGLDCEVDQMEQILGFRNKMTVREVVLRLSYKEVEEMISSKVIMTEGVLLNANTIKTVSGDGHWRKWHLWNPQKSMIEK